MKKFILFFAVTFLMGYPNFGQDHFQCGTTQRLNEIYATNPEFKAEHEAFLNRCFANPTMRSGGDTVYIIPVVFHIVHEYGSENITDAQVYDQMNILNRDYRKLNADTADVVPEFDSIIADAHIEFRLATIDPEGNCTNGINHYYSHETRMGDDFSKLHLWPRNKYLNVWVVKKMRNGVAGYAYYPSATIGYLAFADGIIILNDYIGSVGTSSAFNSRALTHEIGHYLNLAHTWGSTNDPQVACGNDGIPDTPETKGWKTCNLTTNDVCNTGVVENVQNYMEYSYCSRMFTLDQAFAMKQTLNENISYRNNLWTAENLTETGADVTTAPLCAPVADAFPNVKYICAGDNVTFTSASWRAPVDTYTWSFPGGSPATSTSASPTVNYANPGWYAFTLTVTNATGSDTRTFNQAVFVSQAYTEFSGAHNEDFENTTTIPWWVIDNPEGNEAAWHQVTLATAPSGTHCFMLNNHKELDMFSYNYFNQLGGNKDVLLSPSYDLSLTTAASLSFKYSCATHATITDDITEELKVYVSIDCGKTWILRQTISGVDLANAGVASGNYVPPSNSATFWKTSTISLPVSFTKPNVRFKFEYTASDHSNNIYLDDININGLVGIAESVNTPFTFSVYPNPVNAANNLVVAFSNETANMELTLFDVTGKKVYAQTVQQKGAFVELNINLASLQITNGVYVLALNNGSFVQTRKVIVHE